MPTVNSADGFSRLMTKMFDQRKIKRVLTGFQAIFGNLDTGSETVFNNSAEVFEIDIINANVKTAKLVARGAVSKAIGSTPATLQMARYSNLAREYPFAVEDYVIGSKEMLKKLAGEPVYDGFTKQERTAILAADGFHEMVFRHVGLFERLASQSVLEGKQDAILGTADPDQQYDWHRHADLEVTVSVGWNQTTSAIWDGINDICVATHRKGHRKPEMLGVGTDAFREMVLDSDIQGLADNRRYEFIAMKEDDVIPAKFNRLIEGGWDYRGRIITSGSYKLFVFTYQGFYENDAGTAVDLMPTDEAFVCSLDARHDRHFGPSEMLDLTPARRQTYEHYLGFGPEDFDVPENIMAAPGIVDPRMFHSFLYDNSRGSVLTLEVQTAPVFATTETNTIGVLKGLIT